MLFELLCVSLLVAQSVLAGTWNVTAELNPACPMQCEQFNIIYVKAVNSTTSVHCLFAASKRIAPSILLIQSSHPSAHARIDWNRLYSHPAEPSEAILVDGITQSYAVTLLHLVEYNDTNDTADFSQSPSDPEEIILHHFAHLHWNLTSHPLSNPHTLDGNELLEVTYSGNNTRALFSAGGHVDLKFSLSSSEQRNPAMPRIQFVPGLTLQFEISLVQLYTNLSRGRFGVRLGLVSNDSVALGDDFFYSSLFSINDEVTPGIFEMVNLRLGERMYSANTSLDPHSVASWPAGFLQSRPLCYTSAGNREIKTSRSAVLSKRRDFVPTAKLQKSYLKDTLPYLFYGARIVDDPSANYSGVGFRIQNVSFGTPEDGFYAATHFVVWTASFGLGEPPFDSLSPLLIGLLTLSTVVIVSSLLFGTLAIIILRLRDRSSGRFEPLLESSPAEPVPA